MRPKHSPPSPTPPPQDPPVGGSDIAELAAKPADAAQAETRADADLLCRAQAGDQAAFGDIIRHHQAAVFGYLRARLLQASDAEDLTQEVFLRCYSRSTGFDPTAQVRPWLLGIARNLLHEHTRKIKRRKEVAWTELCLELDEMVSSDDELYGDLLGHLPNCLDSLGESARQAVELRYSAHLRLAEIGEKLCRSEGAAKLLMFRAKRALKNCLDRKFEAKP
ncbi:MAG TPA: RNA polymerase sigma factor [Pirellulales bacterium]|nr:RNA polymerase sigma factor [Pirellulales bacterium]